MHVPGWTGLKYMVNLLNIRIWDRKTKDKSRKIKVVIKRSPPIEEEGVGSFIDKN